MKIFRCRLLPFIVVLGLLAACGEKEPEEAVESEAAPATSAEDEDIIVKAAEEQRELTPEEQKRMVDEIMKTRARQQAEGLGSGKVRVNGAWNYTGYSYLSPDPDAAIEARLVAVDVTISGHTPFFDIDDIEIVDGATMISYGSDPHATPLDAEGEVARELPPEAPAAGRWLLIYAYPKDSPSFHLYYWGKKLTREPVEIADRGMELPYPSRSDEAEGPGESGSE